MAIDVKHHTRMATDWNGLKTHWNRMPTGPNHNEVKQIVWNLWWLANNINLLVRGRSICMRHHKKFTTTVEIIVLFSLFPPNTTTPRVMFVTPLYNHAGGNERIDWFVFSRIALDWCILMKGWSAVYKRTVMTTVTSMLSKLWFTVNFRLGRSVAIGHTIKSLPANEAFSWRWHQNAYPHLQSEHRQ